MSATTSRPDPVAPLVQRLVAASGIVFAILLIAAIVISGDSTPEDGAPLAEWTQYAEDNEDNLRIGALLVGLAAYNFLLFLGFLRSHMGDAERAARGFTRGGYIILAAGTAGIVGLTAAIGITAAAVAEPETPPEMLRAMNQLGGGAWLVAAAGIGACLVTTGLLNAGVRALPAWLGWVALAGGLCWVLQLGVLLAEDEDNLFGIFFPLGFLLLVTFCVGASITFLKDLNRTTAGAATPPPSG